MQLDRLALHLRRRGPWEAIDLGCAMARTWWWPVMKSWLAVYVPAALVLYAVLHSSPTAAMLILWWLKPLFDRVALEVLSRAVFGDVPLVREVVRALPRSPGIVASLTLYRVDLARSFNLPVWHLERLRGAAARTRGQALQRRTRSYAVWATVIFLHFEFVITFALLGTVDLFTPATHEPRYGVLSFFTADEPQWRRWIDGALYVVTVSLVEPFYVAAGFALYLNRRTQLEAWDVELALRRLARRDTRWQAAAAALLLALCAGTVVIEPAQAAQAPDARSAVREVLATPEFENYREETRLRRVRSDNAAPTSGETLWSPSLPALQWFAELARILMWVAVALLIAGAVYLAGRYTPAWVSEPKVRAPPPDTLFGLDIAPESLPDDVAGAALVLAEAGRMREALGLLYRGALSYLVNRDGLDVSPGDTEGDCVRRVAANERGDKARFFAALVGDWARTAYAARAPDLERLRALCREWNTHFMRGDGA